MFHLLESIATVSSLLEFTWPLPGHHPLQFRSVAAVPISTGAPIMTATSGTQSDIIITNNRFPINVYVDLRASHLYRHRLEEYNTKLGPGPAYYTRSTPCSAYYKKPINTSGRTGRRADKEDQYNSDNYNRLLHPDSKANYSRLYRVTLCLFKSTTVHAFRLLVDLLHSLRLLLLQAAPQLL